MTLSPLALLPLPFTTFAAFIAFITFSTVGFAKVAVVEHAGKFAFNVRNVFGGQTKLGHIVAVGALLSGVSFGCTCSFCHEV